MDRRYYIMIGIIAAVFCVGSLIFGVDAQSIVRRAAVQQKQQETALNKQLQQESQPANEEGVVTAGY